MALTTTNGDGGRTRRILPALTIFLGSFLAFGVQPMVGRTLLPIFGGTAAVWVVCLCAFQLLLLGGYLYAHTLAVGSVRLRRFHVGLLLTAALLTALMAFWRDFVAQTVSITSVPALDVLLCVVMMTGLAYLPLAANSSFVQSLAEGTSVYRLYAVSNLGSFLGLLTYPFLLEPNIGLTGQWLGFSIGLVLYTGLLWGLIRKSDLSMVEDVDDNLGTGKENHVLWLALPALSCFLLNALTTHVTLDVMPMPLVWTGSLSLFLLSYVFGFSGISRHVVVLLAPLTAVCVTAAAWLHGRSLAQVKLPLALTVYGGLLLVGCSFLHSWLYAIRPRRENLTRYYLFQAVGGAAGGLTASLVFPIVTRTVVEYPFALALIALAALVAISRPPLRVVQLTNLAATVGTILLAGWFWYTGTQKETRPAVYRGRGFFGTIEVLEAKARTGRGKEGRIHEFVHGTTIHGIQALVPGRERMPTTYYTPNASGYAIVAHPKYRSGEAMRVNVTGLGVGVLFCYGRTNDYYRAYEISKDVLSVALNTNLFTFVSDCPAQKEIILGDARKGLEAELLAGVEPYDVIIVDAFTGDNLPYHLSTREAFDLYFRLLKPDGVLCVNISNWHLALEPFMRAVGEHYNIPLLGLKTRDHYPQLQFGAKVACFCRQPDMLAQPPFGMRPDQAEPIDFAQYRPMPHLPTDEKGSFVDLIDW